MKKILLVLLKISIGLSLIVLGTLFLIKKIPNQVYMLPIGIAYGSTIGAITTTWIAGKLNKNFFNETFEW